jgi:hypothetical protein
MVALVVAVVAMGLLLDLEVLEHNKAVMMVEMVYLIIHHIVMAAAVVEQVLLALMLHLHQMLVEMVEMEYSLQ